jgi:hypothetical protein
LFVESVFDGCPHCCSPIVVANNRQILRTPNCVRRIQLWDLYFDENIYSMSQVPLNAKNKQKISHSTSEYGICK